MLAPSSTSTRTPATNSLDMTQRPVRVMLKGKFVGYKVIYKGEPTFVPFPQTTSKTGVRVLIGETLNKDTGKYKLRMIADSREILKPYQIWWQVIGWFKETDPKTKKPALLTKEKYDAEFAVRKK